MYPIDLQWVVNSPSPYNAQLFAFLDKSDWLKLQVHYKKLSLETHPWKSDLTEGYSARSMDNMLGVDWRLFRLALTRASLGQTRWFIVGSWTGITCWMLFFATLLRGHGIVIWTDTPNLNCRRNSLKNVARKFALNWLFRRAHFLMGTGTPALEALRVMGAPPLKLVNFPYWIDLSGYEAKTDQRMDSTSVEEPVVFISPGLIQNKRKGHDVVIRALGELRKKGLMGYEYWIAGTGPDEGALKSLANELGVGDSVRFLGWVEPDDLQLRLASAHVYIHPSPINEPYGVAVIEAMASGLPVLASDLTFSALDRIEVGKSGMVHAAGSYRQLASQMETLIVNPERCLKMGAEAQAVSRMWPLERSEKILQPLLQSIEQG